jgi:hypothetical protein
MTFSHTLYATFTRGEIHPLAQSRMDIDTYRQSLAKCENFTTMKFGGVRRRSGTRYRGQTKFANKAARLFPHVISETQAYALEFGDGYIRPWLPIAQIIGGNGDGGAYPVTSVQHSGQSIQIGAGVAPYEIVSPYTDADLPTINTASINDIVYIVGGGKWPQELKRYGHNNWTLGPVTFYDGPYEPINTDPNAIVTINTLVGTATSGNTSQLAWSSGVAFTAADIGRMVRVQFKGNWIWGTITALTSPTNVSVLWGGGKDDTDPDNTEDDDGDGSKTNTYDDLIENGKTSRSWRLGVFCPNNPARFPTKVAVMEGRVIWARTLNNPRGVYGTLANYVDKFSPSIQDGTVAEDSGFAVELLSGGADPIAWINGAYKLQVGTAAMIRTIGSTDSGAPMSAKSIASRKEVEYGCSEVQPIGVGTSTMYVGRSGRHIYDMYFDYRVNSLSSNNIAIMSEHLLEAGVKEMAYQFLPDGIMWFRTADGKLNGITLEKAESIAGFHTHDIGGFVESMIAVPGPQRDELVMIVRRTINGVTARYIETLDTPFNNASKPDAYFVDCGVTQISGTKQSVVTGLAHLEGVEVAIMADGAQLPRTTVTSGQITLPNNRMAFKCHVGLPIKATGRLLRAPLQSPEGATLGTKKRIAYADFDLYQSRGLTVKSDTGQVDVLRMRSGSDPMNTAPPLYTGIQRILVDGSWESDGVLTFICDSVMPCTVRAINVAIDNEP